MIAEASALLLFYITIFGIFVFLSRVRANFIFSIWEEQGEGWQPLTKFLLNFKQNMSGNDKLSLRAGNFGEIRPLINICCGMVRGRGLTALNKGPTSREWIRG